MNGLLLLVFSAYLRSREKQRSFLKAARNNAIEDNHRICYEWAVLKLLFMFAVSLAVAAVMTAILIIFLRRLRRIEDEFWSSARK